MDVGLVCDTCDGFSPMGAAACSRCGTSLSLDGRSPAAAEPAPEPAPAATCPRCAVPVSAQHAFCPACGAPMQAPPASAPGGERKNKTMFFGAMQAARAKLVLIKGDGLDGVSFTLAGQEHLAGRVDVPLLFDEDPFMSPVHANFVYRDGKLVVRDEESINGVYIRIRGAIDLVPGDRFLVGEQLLDVENTLGDEAIDPHTDGTYFFASPRRASRFRLVQLLRGGETGLAYRAQSDVVSLGREGNDINFPDDPFISGRHAQVSWRDGALVLTDLGSKNGTFLRINGEQELNHGDYVFMGQQLLRVEIV